MVQEIAMQLESIPDLLVDPGILTSSRLTGIRHSCSPFPEENSPRGRCMPRRLSQFVIFIANFALMTASGRACAQTSFGSVNIGSSASSSITFSFPAAVTLGSISAVTQGATGLDFSNAGTGTCATGTIYTAGQTCTVEVTFKPLYAGVRLGAALLKDGAGNVIATEALNGIGVGPQIAYGSGAATVIDPTVNGLPLSKPFGLGLDGAGNLFIADDNHKRVVEVPAGGGMAIAIDPTVNGEHGDVPGDAIVDGAGNLFISGLRFNRVVEVPAGGGAASAIDPSANGIPLNYPCGLVIDGLGDLFIVDVDNDRVVEMPAGATPIAFDPTVNGKALSYPTTIAIDGAGNLFIVDLFNNRVVEMPAGGAAPIAIDPTVNGLSLNRPYGIAVDGAGDLFITDSNNNRVVEVPAGGGAAIAIAPTVNGLGLNDPIDVALDNAGDMFITDTGNNRVIEIQSSQPPALNFAATSVGVIGSDSPQMVQIENIGNAPLTFPVPNSGNNPKISASFTLNGSGASDCPLVTPSSAAPGMLAAGASCQLPVSFQPALAGSVSGALTLTDNNLNAAGPGYATQTIALSGDTPAASLSSTSLWFGVQQLGTTSATQQVTLTNAGSAALSISSIGVTGANLSSFAFPNPCGSTLAPGANCVIQGNFAPTAGGAMTAAITVADNASGSPQTINLTGAGVYPTTVLVTPSAASVSTAQPLTVTVVASGAGSSLLPSGSVTLTIGSYLSAAATLTGGAATIAIPAGSLAAGTDSIAASYTPDNASSTYFESGSGTSSILVTTPVAPVTSTVAASAITASSATVAGTVNPGGADTHVWFLYGVSGSLSGASQTASQDIGSAVAADAVSATLSGLNASATYYFQAVAQNSVGTTSGVINSFTTPAPPTFAVTGSTVTVTAGATTGNTSTITVQPSGGFTGNVALTAAVTASPASAVNPPTLSFGATTPVSISGAAPGTAVLTIATIAASSPSCTSTNQAPRQTPWYSGGAAVLACMLLFGIPSRRRAWQSKWQSKWRKLPGAFLLFIALVGGAVACGSSGTQTFCPNVITAGTTAGSYTITVTATSGSTTSTGTVVLTVQ